ncbi:thioredoxin-related protein [Alkalihalobacillus xiaoxiensis]|uniref:Thioredoxin-related protein n=1 Tax=Shouchella xiaoxiensis TaxID=766895 RepID=A0ABS2SWB9_9BACI|nr:hypothetical protein [Shouchella xiaoxiensis]MBM7839837.1 thioredoxin-related protein [Shouchella xiaoxiensis]
MKKRVYVISLFMVLFLSACTSSSQLSASKLDLLSDHVQEVSDSNDKLMMIVEEPRTISIVYQLSE